MVLLAGINGSNLKTLHNGVSFRGKEDSAESKEQKEGARLLYEEKKKHPIKTGLKIEGEKLKNAFTVYPYKGLTGSKNSNFNEFLTMGIVPYLIGSGMMIGVYSLASKYFDTPSAVNAGKTAKKAALGVLFYGLFKTLSKKFTEMPLNMKYGIDVNLPYRKKIDELPEERNKNNLVSYEYHKVYESVDFPYFDLAADNKAFGDKRNSYFEKIGRKMGFSEEELKHSDQKVKPRIREKLVQAKAFTSLSSYLWAAAGVGIAMQKPFEGLLISPVKRFRDWRNGMKNKPFIADFGSRFAASFKEFIGYGRAGIKDYIKDKFNKKSIGILNKPEAKHIAGRLLLASAAGMTLLGNFFTLTDFKKEGSRKDKAAAAASLIDEGRKKVIC